jgi:hypothetical protein
MGKNKSRKAASSADDVVQSTQAGATGVTGATVATLPRMLPIERARRVADALLRSLVPIIGVLFFHYDSSRLLLLYLFDTAIGLAIAGALTALIMQRLTNDGAGNGRSVIANYFDAVVSSALVALMLMIPLMAPLLFIIGFSEGRAC